MLPKFMYTYKGIRPKKRDEVSEEFNKVFKILTVDEALQVLNELKIKNNTAFYEFYYRFISSFTELMNLKEIVEEYRHPFWGDKYPGIGQKYLRISSIEGEGSYFYDKETDAVYDVEWKDMDDFMAGKLQPIFTSFYDFLEWYYSEENEAK